MNRERPSRRELFGTLLKWLGAWAAWCARVAPAPAQTSRLQEAGVVRRTRQVYRNFIVTVYDAVGKAEQRNMGPCVLEGPWTEVIDGPVRYMLDPAGNCHPRAWVYQQDGSADDDEYWTPVVVPSNKTDAVD